MKKETLDMDAREDARERRRAELLEPRDMDSTAMRLAMRRSGKIARIPEDVEMAKMIETTDEDEARERKRAEFLEMVAECLDIKVRLDTDRGYYGDNTLSVVVELLDKNTGDVIISGKGDLLTYDKRRGW